MGRRRNIKFMTMIFMVVALLLFLPVISTAGSLEPSDPPGPTMKTLDEIFAKSSNVTRFPQCDSRRFLDLMDGTVADCKTGLIWMKDANCFDIKNWFDAKSSCSALTNGNCTLHDDSSAGDWRLPSIRELESLIDYNYSNPALSNAAGDGQWVEGDAFINVQSDWHYWSGTWRDNDHVFRVSMLNGDVGTEWIPLQKAHAVLCVRGGP